MGYCLAASESHYELSMLCDCCVKGSMNDAMWLLFCLLRPQFLEIRNDGIQVEWRTMNVGAPIVVTMMCKVNN